MLGQDEGFTSISESDWAILQKYNVFVDFVDPKLVKVMNTSTFESIRERGVVANVDTLPSNSLLNLHKHVISSNRLRSNHPMMSMSGLHALLGMMSQHSV